MSEKLVLIDGHSILNRTFYGIPELTNSEGLHTNAVYGFLNIMMKLLEDEKADYCVVAFDVKQPTFRHEMYAEYKGTRKPMPEELREQVPVMKEVLKSMNITVAELPGYEADDVLGTLSGLGEKMEMDVVVLSGDRDLLQLATKKVQIKIPKTKKGNTEIENYYEQDVIEKYGVNPKEFIDVKALMGDAADNIPGVPGVGEKTATKLISQYGSIENMYEHISEMKKSKMKESLENNVDSAKMSKVLATIDINAPIDIDLKNAVVDNIYNEETFKLLKKLELRTIMNRFNVSDLNTNIDETIKLADDFEEIIEDIKKCESGIGLHLEQVIGKIAISITTAENNTKILLCDEAQLKAIMTDIIDNNTEISVLDLKKILKIIEISDNANINDIGILAYLVNPLKDRYLYDDVARDYLDITLSSEKDIMGKSTYDEMYFSDTDKFMKIMGYSSCVAYKSSDVLKKKIEQMNMENVYSEIELPLVFSLNRMENKGIRVERNALSMYGKELETQISELEKKIYGEVGEEFNINSPKQLGVILFEKMGIQGGKKTKTGYSTAADVLEKLAPDYPVVSNILKYRQLTKLNSTYAQGLAGYIQTDERIHGTFNQTITSTGRISSTEPNLQNIPIRMEIGKAIRKVFIPNDGCVFIDADYSQIELRILAHMSGDEKLIEAYKEEKDIHRATASQVFHVPLEEVTDEQRRNAKAVNFGIVYGISSFGLSQDLSITRKEAEQYIEDYFKTYPKIKRCIDEFVKNAKEKGYSETMFGRRRPVPELKSSNYMQRSFGERIAMNSPIQGTAADIIKIAMINVDKRLRKEKLNSAIVVQVHDELMLEVPENEIEHAKKILVEEMSNAVQLNVPLEVSAKAGKNWLEAH